MVTTKKRISYSKVVMMALYTSNLLEFTLMMLLKLCIRQVKTLITTTKFAYEPIIDENSNSNEIHKRLLTFFPSKKYTEFHDTIRRGIASRNKFIHTIFLNRAETFTKLPKIEKVFKKNNKTLSKITSFNGDMINACIEIVNMTIKITNREKKEMSR